MLWADEVAEWDRFKSMYADKLENDRYAYCTDSAPAFCSLDAYSDGIWLSVELRGVSHEGTMAFGDVAPEADALFAHLIGMVFPRETIAPRWTLPPSTLALPEDCADIVSDETIVQALGVQDATFVSWRFKWGGGGSSVLGGAAREAGWSSCQWSFLGMDGDVGSLSWLPDGEWAAIASRTPTTERVLVAGLPSPNEASIFCTDGDEACSLDMTFGGNWIRVQLHRDYEGVPTFAVSRRDGVIAIAESVIANLTR